MQKLFAFMLASFLFVLSISAAFSYQKKTNMRGQVDPQSRAWYQYLKDGKDIRLQIPKVPHFFLSNGIRVDYIVDQSLPKVDFRLIVEGGSHEEEIQNKARGVASLWAKTLVFSGSQEFPRDVLANYLEQRASHFSSSSHLKRSSFSLSSLSHFFEEDLQTVLSILQEPRFAKEDVAFVKKQILHSLQGRKEKPSTIAYAIAKDRLWTNSARGNILLSSDVESLTQGDVLAWQEQMWQAQRMRIFITGDFDLEKIKETLEAFFHKTSQVSQTQKPYTEKASSTNNIFFANKEIPQSTILFIGQGIAHSSKDYYALKVFDYILGGGSFDSYLPQKIRTQRGWAYTVYSAHSTWDTSGMIHIFTQTATANTKNVITKIEEILQTPEDYVNSTTVEKAKRAIINRFVFLYSTPAQLISQKLDAEWDGLPEQFLNEFTSHIDKVKLEEVLQVAKKYYQPKNFFVVVVGNPIAKKQITGAKFLIERKLENFVFPQ